MNHMSFLVGHLLNHCLGGWELYIHSLVWSLLTEHLLWPQSCYKSLGSISGQDKCLPLCSLCFWWGRQDADKNKVNYTECLQVISIWKMLAQGKGLRDAQARSSASLPWEGAPQHILWRPHSSVGKEPRGPRSGPLNEDTQPPNRKEP